jgi:RNA polymerase sigma-70 factor (ECF subfamily)
MGTFEDASVSEDLEIPAQRQVNRTLADLVVAAVRGDQPATRQLLDFLWPLVLKYCVDRFGERKLAVAGADDCAQETLIAVVVALPTYRYPSVNFLPFVYGIAGHKVADSFRSHSRDRSDSVSDFAAIDEFERYPLSEDIDRIDERVMIERFLTRLPPLHREILRMRVIDGYSAEETAEALHMPSAGAVRTTQHRALASLRKAMADSDPRRGARGNPENAELAFP